jgi:hypothetical protein
MEALMLVQRILQESKIQFSKDQSIQVLLLAQNYTQN